VSLARPPAGGSSIIGQSISVLHAVALTFFYVNDILLYMTDIFNNTSYQYSGQIIGAGIHGIIGGVGVKIMSAPTAKKPFYYKRTTAEYYYRVQGTEQHRLPWPGSDPTGSHLPGAMAIKLAAGVAAWQVLPEEDKQIYRDRALYHPDWTGYNLFISEYLHAP
jgi:hypothetical protein